MWADASETPWVMVLCTVVAVVVATLVAVRRLKAAKRVWKELSVNYHFTRQCNYQCGFCFHTAKSGGHLPLEKAIVGMRMLREAGMTKINFSGGEPFLFAEHLGEMCREACRLGVTVTIVSNGSMIKRRWFERYGEYVHVLAVSVDSFNHATNSGIGRAQRGTGEQQHLDSFLRVARWCEEYNVQLKMNTTVCSLNKDEYMADIVNKIGPVRWKVFQTLEVEGENAGKGALRDASSFVVSNEEFERFVERNHAARPVPEGNQAMRASYLILDEHMRFLDCSTGGKIPSPSILDVGVERALELSGFDDHEYIRRGGDWYSDVRRQAEEEQYRLQAFDEATQDIEDLNVPSCTAPCVTAP